MSNIKKNIYVTQPTMPPLEEFTELLKQIWDNKILTNGGPFHQELEKALADYLGVKYISLFSNGTLALVTALQALRITGEVITTPFSFVATTHSLWWNNIKPIFADIDADYNNLDPEKIEAAITPNTTAILPVHVHGNPCNVDRIQKIADTYNLKVIYDAAHAFAVKINGNSILNYGDLSVLSFHATKVFNTFEGGAIICHDEKMKKHIDDLKNFGFRGETIVVAPGINAKMSEVQAAFGLLNLKYIDTSISHRKEITNYYRENLKNIQGIRLLNDIVNVSHNYSYFPVFVNETEYGMLRDDLYELLKRQNIFSRRYFYPLISEFSTYKGLPSSKKENLPVATRVAIKAS
jgi:dTDP-4-amino-4,6-dideoxygalactose transaminase